MKLSGHVKNILLLDVLHKRSDYQTFQISLNYNPVVESTSINVHNPKKMIVNRKNNTTVYIYFEYYENDLPLQKYFPGNNITVLLIEDSINSERCKELRNILLPYLITNIKKLDNTFNCGIEYYPPQEIITIEHLVKEI